jgi:hypothetical protein
VDVTNTVLWTEDGADALGDVPDDDEDDDEDDEDDEDDDGELQPDEDEWWSSPR